MNGTDHGTDNRTQECNPLNIYDPNEAPVSSGLLWVAIIHCYFVIIIGTLGNALALWCVSTCNKTRRPVKVLLFSVFVPALLVCLATRFVINEIRIALLTCDTNRVSRTVVAINMLVYNILAQVELAAIAAIAVVRAVSVWSPQSRNMSLRGAVLVVFGICLYAILTGLGVLVIVKSGEVDESWSILTTLYALNTTLPALITAAAYCCMIFVIHRGRRRLAISQHQEQNTTTLDQTTRATTTLDHATRAMLAVFISNLIFGIPHSIFHLLPKQPHYMNIIFHVLFSTHFVADPLAFVWFNSGYKNKVKRITRSISIHHAPSFINSAFADSHDQHNTPSQSRHEP